MEPFDNPTLEPPTALWASVRWTAFRRHPGLARVQTYLDQDLARPLTLGIAARVAGLHPKYFSALFHERVGVRFIDWLHLMRTEHAKRLLDGTDLAIAEVAERAGYRDLRTFERAFKKSNGRTARQYRQRHRTAGGDRDRPRPGLSI